MMLNVVSMTMDGDGWWMVWLSIVLRLWFLVDCVNDRYLGGLEMRWSSMTSRLSTIYCQGHGACAQKDTPF
jgi:hypothetical protein